MSKKLKVPEDIYIAISNLQRCRMAIDCLRGVLDDRAKTVLKTLYEITDELEERIND